MFNTKLALVVAALAMTLAPVGFAQAEKTCTGSCSSCTTSTSAGVAVKAKLPPPGAAPCCPQEAPGAKTCTSGSCEKTATVRVRLVDPQEAPSGCSSCQKKTAAAEKKTAKGSFVVATRAAPEAAKKANASCGGDCDACEESCTVVETIVLDDVTNAPSTITFVGSAEQEAPGGKDCESKGKKPATGTFFGLAKQEAPCCGECQSKEKKPARIAGRVINLQGADAGEYIIVGEAPQRGGDIKTRRLVLDAGDLGVDAKAVEIIKEIEAGEVADLLGAYVNSPHAVNMTTDSDGTFTFAWTQEEGCPKCKTCPKCKKCTTCDKCKKASGPHAAYLRKMIDAHHPGMQGLPPMIMEHLGELHAAHAAPGHGPDIQVFVDGKLVYSSKPHKAHSIQTRVVRREPITRPGHVDALLRRVDLEEASEKKAEAILLKLRAKEKATQAEQKKETRIRWAVPDTQKKAAEVRKKAAEVRKQAADARKKAAAAKKKAVAKKRAVAKAKAAARKKAAQASKEAEIIVERIGIKGAEGKAQRKRKGTRTLPGASVKPPRRAAGVILGGPKAAQSQSEMEQLRKDIDELRASLRKLTQEVRRLNRDR